jgi:VWFA-related protein
MSPSRVAIVIFLIAAAAAAQVRESVTVNLIEVPVTVVDGSGNPIRGLKAADFEIFDQGKKREITSFDTIDFGVRDGVTATSPMNPAARRSFLLLFDLGYSSPNSLARAQDAARRFVKESVKPRDLVGVGTIDVDRGFHLLTMFTTDRELIASAIGNPLSFRSTDPLQIANQISVLQVDEPLTGQPDPGTFKGLALQHQIDVARGMKREGAGAVRKRVEKQVDILGDLAKVLRSVPGRKQIIFLSEGFDAAFLQGRDVKTTSGQKKENEIENNAAMSGSLWDVDSDARYGSVTGLTTLNRMASYFRSSDVVLHAIDIKGVRVQSDVAEGEAVNSNAGLFAVARPTGGFVFQNSNDLTENFARMLRGQEVVYVLGFQAPAVKAGSFHELSVKVAGVNAARASYRAGYFEAGAESVAERALSDAEIIVNDVPKRDVRVDAIAAAFLIDETHAQVPVVLEINGEDLLRSAKDGQALAEVYVYAFDADGVVRDRLFEKMRLDVAKAGDRLHTTGVKFIAALTLPPGDYAVKSLVIVPDSGRRGFARANVKVPRAGETAASAFFLDAQPPQWVLVRGTTLDVGHYPFQMGGQPFVPSAAARLRKGETRRFVVFVAGAQGEPVEVGAEMIAKEESPGLSKLLYAYDPTTHPPGPTTLQIKAGGQVCSLQLVIGEEIK